MPRGGEQSDFGAVPVEQWIVVGLDTQRANRLLSPFPASELIDTIARAARHAASEGSIQLNWVNSWNFNGYGRTEATIGVSNEVFDKLFNGRSGYRAQYYMSEADGLRFNQRLVSALVPAIETVFHLTADGRQVPWSKHAESLRGPYSKIWVAGDARTFDAAPLALRPERWATYWDRAGGNQRGLRAPTPIAPQIDLKGVFLDDNGTVLDDPKPERAREIHATGWT